jgi:hypothetical protein
MIIRLLPRVLKDLASRDDLTCSCGGFPDLSQPSGEMPEALLGVCSNCQSWTLYAQLEEGWRSAQAFELAQFKAAIDNQAVGAKLREPHKRRVRRPARARAS